MIKVSLTRTEHSLVIKHDAKANDRRRITFVNDREGLLTR
jgi:hypothetical protein